MNNGSVLLEYNKRFPRFLEDESMRRVIDGVGQIIMEHLIEFAELGAKSAEMLIEAYDPCPESVPHFGDPIGMRGPSGEKDPWNDYQTYLMVKGFLEDTKNRLEYHRETLNGA